jgi:hypothetical protein
MNIPMRTSFMRTVTPQAASPNEQGPRVDTTFQTTDPRRSGQQERGARQLALSKSLEPDEATRNEAVVAPGCGRIFCQQCSFENSLTWVHAKNRVDGRR